MDQISFSIRSEHVIILLEKQIFTLICSCLKLPYFNATDTLYHKNASDVIFLRPLSTQSPLKFSIHCKVQTVITRDQGPVWARVAGGGWPLTGPGARSGLKMWLRYIIKTWGTSLHHQAHSSVPSVWRTAECTLIASDKELRRKITRFDRSISDKTPQYIFTKLKWSKKGSRILRSF